MYDLDRFTGQDVMKWVGCDKESGKKIFEQAGFYNAICTIVSANFAKKYHKTFDEVMLMSREKTHEVFLRLKKNRNETYDFDSPNKFFSYYYGSLLGLLKNHYFPKPSSGSTIETDQVDIDSDGSAVLVEVSEEESWLLKYQMKKISESAKDLVEAFRDWLDQNKKLGEGIKKHFSALFFIRFQPAYQSEQNIGNHIYILAFLQKNNEYSDIIKEYFLKLPEFNKNNYSSNNWRLRKQWDQFLVTEKGLGLYQRLVEEIPHD